MPVDRVDFEDKFLRIKILNGILFQFQDAQTVTCTKQDV